MTSAEAFHHLDNLIVTFSASAEGEAYDRIFAQYFMIYKFSHTQFILQAYNLFLPIKISIRIFDPENGG
jgi:hypothetical protein